jgi:hypothetical protein
MANVELIQPTMPRVIDEQGVSRGEGTSVLAQRVKNGRACGLGVQEWRHGALLESVVLGQHLRALGGTTNGGS